MAQREPVMPEKFTTIPAVCDRYLVSSRTVRRYVSQGLLTGYRVGPRMVRLDPDEVDRVLGGKTMGREGAQ